MNRNVLSKQVNFSYEQIEKLREAMCYLSPKQRSVLYMRFWDNMTINEIARQIGQTWTATDIIIDSAINHLKIRLLNPAHAVDSEISAQVLQFASAA